MYPPDRPNDHTYVIFVDSNWVARASAIIYEQYFVLGMCGSMATYWKEDDDRGYPMRSFNELEVEVNEESIVASIVLSRLEVSLRC